VDSKQREDVVANRVMILLMTSTNDRDEDDRRRGAIWRTRLNSRDEDDEEEYETGECGETDTAEVHDVEHDVILYRGTTAESTHNRPTFVSPHTTKVLDQFLIHQYLRGYIFELGNRNPNSDT